MREKRLILLIILFFLFLQAIFLIYYPVKIDGDAIGYLQIAKSIKENNIFSFDGVNPTALRTPGYPLFLYSLYSLNYLFIYFIQAILLLISGFLAKLIYEKIFDKKGSWLVFLSVLFFPPLFFYTHFLITEILFTFLLLFSFLLFIYGVQSNKKIILFLSGVFFGITCLVRPTILFVLFVLFFIMFLYFIFNFIFNHRKISKKNIILLFLVFLGFVLAYSPWVIRNYVVFDSVVLDTTFSGIALNLAFEHAREGSWDGGYSFYEPNQEIQELDKKSQNEIDRDKNHKKYFFKKASEKPFLYLKKYFDNIFLLISKPDLFDEILKKALYSEQKSILFLAIFFSLIYFVIYFIIFILFLIYAFLIFNKFIFKKIRLSKSDFFLFILFFLVLFSIFLHGFTQGVPRYFVPFFPFVAIIGIRLFYLIFISKIFNNNKTTFHNENL